MRKYIQRSRRITDNDSLHETPICKFRKLCQARDLVGIKDYIGALTQNQQSQTLLLILKELIYGVYPEQTARLETKVGPVKFKNVLSQNKSLVNLYSLQKDKKEEPSSRVQIPQVGMVDKKKIIIGGGTVIALILIVVLARKYKVLLPMLRRLASMII